MTSKSDTPDIVLASTSPFRQALLNRLRLTFVTAAPHVDESRLADEDPEAMVLRLAADKATAVARRYPHALIIGSDQVACIDGLILGKPGSRDRAIEQLILAAGRPVQFYTGLSLLNAATGHVQTVCEPYTVHFRRLSKRQIERYVDAEQPFNCAGSFKSEGLGIVLFERFDGDDPNSLIGLPLIRLVSLLETEGIQLPLTAAG